MKSSFAQRCPAHSALVRFQRLAMGRRLSCPEPRRTGSPKGPQVFHTGETMPEAAAAPTPPSGEARRPAPVSGAAWIRGGSAARHASMQAFAGELFGAGQPLDAFPKLLASSLPDGHRPTGKIVKNPPTG